MFVVRTECWFLSHMFFLPLVCSQHGSVCMKASMPIKGTFIHPNRTTCLPSYPVICTEAESVKVWIHVPLSRDHYPDWQCGTASSLGMVITRLLVSFSSRGCCWVSGPEVLCQPCVDLETSCDGSRLLLCPGRCPGPTAWQMLDLPFTLPLSQPGLVFTKTPHVY